MGTVAKDTSGGTIAPPPAGPTQGACYAVIDIGTQMNKRFGKARQQVVIIWELPIHRIDIERDGVKKNMPRAISQMYTLSLADKANLRADLEAWRGKPFTAEQLKGFDVKNVLGANALINIVHKQDGDKTYANVGSIMPIIPPMKKLAPEHPQLHFDLETFLKGGRVDAAALPEMPDWIKAMIMQSEEWVGASQNGGHAAPADGEGAGAAEPDDDVPF